MFRRACLTACVLSSLAALAGCDLLLPPPPTVIGGGERPDREDEEEGEGEGEEGEGEGEGEGPVDVPPDIRPDPAGPNIQSFDISTTRLRDFDSAQITVVVTDVDGADDIVGPLLIEPVSGRTLGTLSTSGPGTFTASVAWSTFAAIDPVEFSSGNDQRFVRVQFSDIAGHQVTQTQALTMFCDGNAPACNNQCGALRCPGQDNECVGVEGALSANEMCGGCNVGCAGNAGAGAACFNPQATCGGGRDCLLGFGANSSQPDSSECRDNGGVTLRDDNFLSWTVDGVALPVSLVFNDSAGRDTLGATLCANFGGLEFTTNNAPPPALASAAEVVVGVEEPGCFTSPASCEPLVGLSSVAGNDNAIQVFCVQPIAADAGLFGNPCFNGTCSDGSTCSGGSCVEFCPNLTSGDCDICNLGGTSCRCDVNDELCKVGADPGQGEFGQPCVGGTSCNGGNLVCDTSFNVCEESCFDALDCTSCNASSGNSCSCDLNGQCVAGGGGGVGNTGEGRIQLVNGPSSRSGRLEIFLNGAFGTVCDDGFGVEEAQVVCRQLGFSGGTADAGDPAPFGEGTGLTLLDSVVCSGSESRLFDCSHSSIEDCTHAEDVGVICQ